MNYLSKFTFLVITGLLFQICGFSQAITLEEIYRNYSFFPASIENIRSMNDGLHYTTLEQGQKILKWDYATGTRSGVVFDAAGTELQSINDYEFSSDESMVLLSTSKEKIYRYSYKAEYFIFHISEGKLIPLSHKGKQLSATFSPDGSMIAFVRDNNLFITDVTELKETQITFDGELNRVINGTADWVYEEEFALKQGFKWSPDSRKIAYIRFDESEVREFSMTMYKGLYPQERRFKYPKAGEKNSLVSIHVYDTGTKKTVRMDTGSEPDQYIPRMLWTQDPSKLSILRLNRLQNKLDILHANANTGESTLVYTEESDKYINEPDDNTVIYIPGEPKFILQSERSGWLHFWLYDYNSGKISPITSGEFDISQFLGFDEKSSTLYYLSHERGARFQDIYSIHLDGKDKKLISREEGWSTAEFSRNFQYYIITRSAASQPPVYGLYDSKGKEIRILEDNSELKEKIKQFGFVEKEFISIPAGPEINLDAWIMKPRDFDPGRKYPLFINVYGGPQSQEVIDAWSYSDSWFQMLVQKGYIVACIDGRGTDGRGEAFRKATYMQLGKFETEDQIASAQWLSAQPYIDPARIGIFGWSYGGYMSLLCLFKGAEVYKMAISVAPVTNWRYYDSVYTERFMRRPQENPTGYDDNSPINHVANMKGNLLLVHGMADDNVHFQNSVELVQKLIEHNKSFDMQFYPNRNHGIYGGNATLHLYSKMTDFIEENL